MTRHEYCNQTCYLVVSGIIASLTVNTRGSIPRSQGGGGRGGHHSGSSIPSGTQVYVGNLATETNWRDLKDLFKQCGEVDRAEVRQGFGTVRFTKKEDAQAAIERMNGAKLHDRTLEVRLDDRS